MSGPLKVVIRVDSTGRGSTFVDGQDLSSHISGVAFESSVHGGTHLRLDFVDVDMDVEGNIESTSMGDEWVTYRLGKIIRDELQEGAKA